MINKKWINSRIFSFSLIIVFSVFFYNLAFGGITAKPGNFDHLKIEIPDRVIAGNEYKILITAVDAFGNSVVVTDGTKDLKIIVSGSAKVKPDHFKLNEIPLNGLSVIFVDEVAEEVVFSLYEANKVFPIFEKRIKVLPAELKRLSIEIPSEAQVGTIFYAKIYGKDKFGNLICDGLDIKALNLFFQGDVSPQIKDMRYLNDTCTITAALYSEKTGSFYAEATLLDRDVKGRSEKIKIKNAQVNSFIIQSKDKPIAGEPFELDILAVDKFGNLVEDFASTTQKILIEAKGQGYVFPSELSSYAFTDGKVRVNLRYDRAEDIRIVVKLSHDYSVRGESEVIKVEPPKVKRFEVIAPDTVIAGQKFKIKVIAYNQLDKVMSNYNLYGSTVVLKTTGSGTLTPNRIPSTEFINGVAVIEVMYDKAENFEIIASAEEVLSKEIKPIEKKEKVKKEVEKKPEKEKKAIKPTVLELKNISLVETKKGCSLTLYVPNIKTTGNYTVTTKKRGKDIYILLEIQPAKNKLETPVKFNSEFIKDIAVEETANKLHVNITLKKPLKYKTKKVKDEILIEFRKV